MAPIDSDSIARQARLIAEGAALRDEKLLGVCNLLKEEVEHYDWVGFYLVSDANPAELVLGPYAGASTDHTSIPFGQGVCGQCAEREETIVVQDVSKESNYLSCSIHVQSEIVVPVMRDGTFVGEIDIDSHEVAPFTDADSAVLERVAEIVAPII